MKYIHLLALTFAATAVTGRGSKKEENITDNAMPVTVAYPEIDSLVLHKSYPAYVTASRRTGVTARHFELLAVDEGSCIVVMMTSDSRVKSQLLRMQLKMEPEQMPGVVGLLNSHFTGISSEKMNQKLLPVAEQIFLAQKKVIEDLAEQGPCIFVGRCADYILRNKPKILKVFIYADPKERVSRSIEKYGQMAEQAEELIRHIDKQRRLHYEAYTVQEWGDRNNYHLMLDSQAFGVEGCVDIICGAVLSLDKKPSP